MSYEQIFEITRIQPSILREIEEGRASSVAPVFLKGFIKTYARFLGLNPEDIFSQSQEGASQKSQKKPAGPSGEPSAPPQPVRSAYALLFVGFFIVFLWIGVMGGPAYFNKEAGTAKNEAPAGADKSSEGDAPGGLDEAAIAPKDSNSAEGGQSAGGSPDLLDQIAESVFQKELLIRSFETLQIYFKTDRQATVTKILKPSVWFHIKAQTSIYIRFDEYQGAVQMFYNGEQVDLGNRSFFERAF